MQIIYGQGLHSHARYSTNNHPVKEAVTEVIKEMSIQGVSGQEDKDNPGLFHLSINKLQKTQTSTIQPSSTKTGLNPNAAVFVPRFG